MITLCPHCGHHLPQPLLDGMSSCYNCRRAFDSSRRNLLLATSWLIRRKNICSPDHISDHYGLTMEDAEFIVKCIDDECYCHEDFLKILNQKLTEESA
jgi:hypothetical protein